MMRLRSLKRLVRRFGPQRGVVLLYHRVANLETDPQLLAVSPTSFHRHMEVLAGTCAPTSLEDLLDRAQRGTLDRRAVAVTFDDGYADNVANALPVLRNAAVPATVFIVAGQIGQHEEFWWDDLERLMLVPDSVPERLQLVVDGASMTWDLSRRSGNGADRWDVLSAGVRTPRQAAYLELWRLLRGTPGTVRADVLTQLRSWAGASSGARPGYLPVTHDEVSALVSEPGVRIGAHSMTHPVLSSLSRPEQQDEVQNSKRALEDLVGSPVELFSYPFGGKADYSPETLDLVEKSGFALACANYPATVTGATPQYEVPRFVVRNWTGEEFARQLESYFDE